MIPYTISYMVVCGVSLFNPYNKDENNKFYNFYNFYHLSYQDRLLTFCFFIYNRMNGLLC